MYIAIKNMYFTYTSIIDKKYKVNDITKKHQFSGLKVEHYNLYLKLIIF